MKIDKTPSQEAKEIAAAATYKNLAQWGSFPDGNEEDTIELLIKHGNTRINGYDLAKAMDDDYWGISPNAEIVECLDGFSSALERARDNEIKRWIEREGITPPLAVGTRVVWQSYKGIQSGEITGIYEYSPAKYMIKVDGDVEANTSKNSRHIVWWDNVEKEE